LVDLYLAQNHVTAAMDLLEKFLEANPRDDRSRQRLEDLKAQHQETIAHLQVVEEDGQEELLRLVQTQVQSANPKKIEKVFHNFLQQIQLRADESRYQHV